MIAMHYGVELPADFDMRRIRERVAAKAPEFDGYPDMSLKAFLVRDRRHPIGIVDRPNYYGAFYVWRTEAAARGYLLGDKFANFVAAIGRPAVRTWPLVEVAVQPRIAARFAVIAPLPVSGGNWRSAFDRARADIDAALGDPAHGAAIVAIDPGRESGVRVDLWDVFRPHRPNPAAERFEVLHVSQPALVPVG